MNKEISDYIRSLGAIPPIPAPPLEPWTRDGDTWVRKTATPANFNQFVILDVNASTIWPGSVVQGASLRQVGLTQISLSRRPTTVMMSNVRGRVENAKPLPLSTTVEKPNAATVNEAISQLLQNIDSKSTTPQVAFNQVEFTSAEQAFTKIGTSISAVVADVRAQLQSDEYAHRNNRMIDFSQRYFTLSVIPEGNPSAYFSDDVALDDVKAVTSVDNPPVYITDIAYGRRLLLLFSSTASADDLRVALNTTFSVAVVSGDLNVSVATKAVFAKTDLRGIVIGGEGTTAIGVFSGDSIIDGLKKYLQAGAVLSPESTGAPISFRASYLKDNSLADVQMLTIDRQVSPATADKFFLRWYNHLEPDAIYKVVANMEPGRYGGDLNNNYKPYVVRLNNYPGRVINQTEVAGDQTFKRPANSWTAPPMNCPSLLQNGLDVMDDERWYLVEYIEDVPPPH